MDGANMPNYPKQRNTLAKCMPARIKSVSRALGYCLLLDDTNAWLKLRPILVARLSATERAALAYIGLKSLSQDEAYLAASAALGADYVPSAGLPIAPLFNHMDEAAFWADMAAPDEHEAYCLASFKAMPHERQSAFLEFVQGRQVA